MAAPRAFGLPVLQGPGRPLSSIAEGRGKMSPAGPLRFDKALALAGGAATPAFGLDSQTGPSPYHPVPWGEVPDGRECGRRTG